MHYDHGGNENNSNKSAGNAVGSANTRNSGGVCSTDGNIPHTEARKADKLDNKFSTIKDHVTLQCTFSKYWIVIAIRENCGKIGPIN